MSRKNLTNSKSFTKLSFRRSPRSKSSASSCSQDTWSKGLVNGFDALLDVQAVAVQDEHIAAHTLPLEALLLEPGPSKTHHRFSSGLVERRLFLNTELEADEQRQMEEMRAMARSRGLVLLPYMTAQANRFLAHSQGNVAKSLDTMQSVQDWRIDFFKAPLASTTMMEDLKHGVVYWCGRDAELRPTLVFRANRIPEEWKKNSSWDKVIGVFIFCLEYCLRYMLVPGKVETWNIIIDLAGMGVRQIPVSALQAIQKKVGSAYPGRINKFYIVRMSKFLSPLVSVGKSMMSERQIQKLAFMKDATGFADEFALPQLEKDLGGTRDEITQFFPFPLLPGPFTAGYSGQTDNKAAPNLHVVMSEACSRGSLWDSSRDPKENRQLPFDSEWTALLAGYGVSVPRRWQEDNIPADGPVKDPFDALEKIVKENGAILLRL
mmetsp:Transcript_11219/g.20469  ORF Transcript_11219/g.20469 Transcript_11219/m.20469 type:complete len:434 (+) Transcript_11219:129-1430(+)